MRKLVIVAVLALLLPSALSAQGGGGGGRGRGMGQNVAKLVLEKKADLALSEDQVAKLTVLAARVDSLNAPINAEMRKLRDASASREDMMAKMEEVRPKRQKIQEDALAELNTILTPEQQPKAKEIIDAARPPGRRGGGGR